MEPEHIEPKWEQNETYEEYSIRLEAWKKAQESAVNIPTLLRRRWLIIFLASVMAFCTFFTPWRLHWKNEIVFLNYAPIYSTWEHRGYGDIREIDIKRAGMWIIIIGLGCSIGFMIQNKGTKG